MGSETRASSQEGDDDIERRVGLPQDANREQRSANRTNDRMDGIPSRVDPRDLVSEKLEEKKRPRDPKNNRLAQYSERLVGRAEHDPMLVDRQAAHKNREIKIETSEAGKAERDTKELQLIHAGTMRSRCAKSRAVFLSLNRIKKPC